MDRRITFVLPHLSFSGGNKIIVTYAEALANRGHEVTLVHGRLPSLKARIAARFFPHAAHIHRPAPNVRLVEAKGRVAELDKFLPDADAVVATWWETVEAVGRAPESKGRKFHLVQGHEVWSYLPERAADVYRLPFHKIAVSNWLLGLMRDKYGSSDVSLVMNPVDVDRFAWVAERSRGQVPTVGTVYSLTPVKNSAMAFEAVQLAREQIPDLRLICFGADKLPKEFDLPFVEYSERPEQDAIPDLYRRCDFWLFTSTEEGFGLPILEAMAVGTPVVATPAGAAPDLVTPKTGALVGLDAAEMAQAIVRSFAKPSASWTLMSRACRATAEAHDLDSAVSSFEAIVCA